VTRRSQPLAPLSNLSNAIATADPRSAFGVAAALAVMLTIAAPLSAAPVSRPQTSIGTIVSTQGDEQMRLVEAPDWRAAQLEQGLLAGDQLRTGGFGALTLLFADRTQLRVHRNSNLLVRAAPSAGNANTLRLERGATWSRATPAGAGVRIETPSATAAIRGTDWSLAVGDDGRTTLIVLDGTVELTSPSGSVLVSRGEIAFAEIGRAPTKTILSNPNDRQQMLFNLSLVDGLKSFSLREERFISRRPTAERLAAMPETSITAAMWFDLAELWHDLADFSRSAAATEAGRQGAGGDQRLLATADYMTAFLIFQDHQFERAAELLGRAAPRLEGRRRILAELARAGALILSARADEGARLFRDVETRHPREKLVHLVKAYLMAYAGDLPAAMAFAGEAENLFPGRVEFPFFQAIIATTLDRRAEAEAAVSRALAVDAEAPTALLAQASFLLLIKRDAEGAIAALQRAIAIHPNGADLWGTLGYAHHAIDERPAAERAYLEAMRHSPKNVVHRTNYVLVLLETYRLAEAAEQLTAVDAIDPARDVAYTRHGKLALQRDDLPAAEAAFLRATTVNPALAEAGIGLAVTYYQQGEFDRAEQALRNADRLDENNPANPLIGSVMAINQAQADKAIGYGREAIRRHRQQGGTGAIKLAATRGGNNSLGVAYTNLGLNDWGGYYGELSFDPYSADSHFFRAARTDAVQASFFQGLLLDPLAVSGRTRYTDFFRRPFTDVTISGSVGDPGHGSSHTQALEIQGFTYLPQPLSYFATAQNSYTGGDREHAYDRTRAGTIFLGAKPTAYDRMLLALTASDGTAGVPWQRAQASRDDTNSNTAFDVSIGFGHEFGARNHLLARVGYRHQAQLYRNADPFGRGLTPVEYSLVKFLGSDGYRRVQQTLGLFDLTPFTGQPDSALVFAGQPGPGLDAFPLPALSSQFDTRSLAKLRVEQNSALIQARHLFTVGDVDLSYGAEFSPFRTTTDGQALVFQSIGTGVLTGSTPALAPGVPFPYGEVATIRSHDEQSGLAANLHANALWRASERVWLEAGIFGQHYASGSDDYSLARPRVGFAWQVTERHWLRAALRHDAALPIGATLTPVATVGLVPDAARLAEGGRRQTYLARWDAEWSLRFFTAVQVARQDLNRFSVPEPGALTTQSAAQGQIDTLSAAANLWIGGGFGLIGGAAFNASENRSGDGNDGKDLALVPRYQISGGLTWVHPSQLRATLLERITGPRAADTVNTARLPHFLTTDLTLTWQPLDKWIELGAAITNLLDERYDAALDLPAPGRAFLVVGRLRF